MTSIDFERKIAAPHLLTKAIAQLARPIVLTNGVFDILHRGHVTYLAQARALGASLVVALNSDASARQLGKGSDRPLNSYEDRAAVLASLEAVSLVIGFVDRLPLPVIDIIKPDVYVKGGDYSIDELPEAKLVRSYGGRAIAIPWVHDRSTSGLLSRIRSE